MAPTTLPRRTVAMPPELADAFDDLAERRFGGKASPAMRAAIEMALIVYDDPSTFRSANGVEALADFVVACGGTMPQDA